MLLAVMNLLIVVGMTNKRYVTNYILNQRDSKMEEKNIKNLVNNWHRCGMEKRDAVMVHSSLSRLLRKLKK
jgi:hypothetical protein